MMDSNETIGLLHLPDELIETIISYLTYHETSEARIVCKLFNKFCQERLNRGFAKVDKLHGQIQKEVKNKLPRRESERRNHQLARHVDILSAIETRLSLLGMSYSRYMETGLCCFIPGKVLDELMSILHRLQTSDQAPRSHEFLQELRDISSMAMEHFDEKIVPGLKYKLPSVTSVTLPYFSESCSSLLYQPSPVLFQSTPSRGPSVRHEITNLIQQVKAATNSSQQVHKVLSEVKLGWINNKKRILDQEKKIVQQGQYINELEKKFSDLNQKFVDLTAEVQILKGISDKGESSKTISHLHSEEYTPPHEEFNNKTVKEDNNEKCARNKGLKRKTAGKYSGRVKRSKN
ncbi:F-box protein 28 [Mactra antiquata]